MKRFLQVLGGAALLLILAGVVGFILFAPQGRRLDDTSREYVAHVIEQPMKNWDLAALKAESSEELLGAVPDEKLAMLLQTFSARLGSIRSHGSPRGEAHVALIPFRRVVTADYVVPATFEKAEGQVYVRCILKGSRWRLLAVNVNSDALIFR